MKSIRTTTVALVGIALLTVGALTGCSSDSNDKGSDKTTASEKSKGSGDSKGGGSSDLATFCDPADQLASIDPTDFGGYVEFYKDWRDAAPSDTKADFDTIIDNYEAAASGNMSGLDVQAVTAASENITKKLDEVCY